LAIIVLELAELGAIRTVGGSTNPNTIKALHKKCREQMLPALD